MFRLYWRGSLILTFLLICIVVGWAGISRLLLPPMPDLLYVQDRALYTVRSDCGAFLQDCAVRGRKLVDNLYSFPVASGSPDGQFVAVHLQSQWMFYRADCLLESRDCTPVPLDPAINDARPAWGPDGSVIAFMDSTGQGMTVLSRGCWDGSPPSACLRQSVPLTSRLPLGQPDWSADGRYMVLSQLQPPGLVIFDMTCLDDARGCLDSQYSVMKQPSSAVSWPSFSPDGGTILYFTNPSQSGIRESLYVMDIQSGTSRPITFHSSSTYPVWSKDGRYIVFTGYDVPREPESELYLMDFKRGIVQRFVRIAGKGLYSPTWAVPR